MPEWYLGALASKLVLLDLQFGPCRNIDAPSSGFDVAADSIGGFV